MAEANSTSSSQRSTRTCVASEVQAGMRVMRSRRVHVVVGAVRTSAAHYAITTRPEDEPDASPDPWVGSPDTQWTVVVDGAVDGGVQ